MPQMAPLSWMSLFLLFSLFIMFTASKIWFSDNLIHNETLMPNKPSSTSSNSYTWKW